MQRNGCDRPCHGASMRPPLLLLLQGGGGLCIAFTCTLKSSQLALHECMPCTSTQRPVLTTTSHGCSSSQQQVQPCCISWDVQLSRVALCLGIDSCGCVPVPAPCGCGWRCHMHGLCCTAACFVAAICGTSGCLIARIAPKMLVCGMHRMHGINGINGM